MKAKDGRWEGVRNRRRRLDLFAGAGLFSRPGSSTKHKKGFTRNKQTG